MSMKLKLIVSSFHLKFSHTVQCAFHPHHFAHIHSDCIHCAATEKNSKRAIHRNWWCKWNNQTPLSNGATIHGVWPYDRWQTLQLGNIFWGHDDHATLHTARCSPNGGHAILVCVCVCAAFHRNLNRISPQLDMYSGRSRVQITKNRLCGEFVLINPHTTCAAALGTALLVTRVRVFDTNPLPQNAMHFKLDFVFAFELGLPRNMQYIESAQHMGNKQRCVELVHKSDGRIFRKFSAEPKGTSHAKTASYYCFCASRIFCKLTEMEFVCTFGSARWEFYIAWIIYIYIFHPI